MDRIISEIWMENQKWDGYKLAKRPRVHLRVQSNSCFEGHCVTPLTGNTKGERDKDDSHHVTSPHYKSAGGGGRWRLSHKHEVWFALSP